MDNSTPRGLNAPPDMHARTAPLYCVSFFGRHNADLVYVGLLVMRKMRLS